VASRNAKINVVVDGLRQVQELEKSLRKISSLADKVNGKSGKSKETQKKDQRLKEEIKIERILNSISAKRNQLFQINSKDAKVSAIKHKLTRAENLAMDGKIIEAQKQLAIGTKRMTQLQGETAEIKRQTEELKAQQAIANKGISASGPFSRISDRQSRDREGKRTFMNNPFVGGMAKVLPKSMQPTRGFDLSSAAIGGGFPLLFGGGPVQAAAGALGGGIGGMFGQGGGFAGSIAATAAVQAIQQTITAVADLGKAMGPFTQNTNALVDAMGLAGTAEGKRIEIIKELEGEQAAFNAVMQKMREAIGTEATKRLQDFGEKASLVGSEFQIAMTKMRASLVPIINLVDQLLGISKGAQEAQRKRFIENTKNPVMVQKREEIETLKETTGGGRGAAKRRSDRIEVLQEELDKMADIGIALENQAVKMSEITLEHDKLVKKAQEEKDLKEAVKKLTETGMSEAIAKEVVQRQQVGDKAVEELEQLKIKLRLQNAALSSEDMTTEQKKKQKDLYDSILKKQENITKETEKAVEAIEKQGKAIKEVKVTKEQVADLLANEMANGIQGLIEGTKSLGDVLASVAKNLASMFLQAGTSNLFSKIFKIPAQAQGGYNRAGGFKAFQYGGVVNSPTLGMIGEGGESEYVIPASKMAGAMQRYSSGARGGAVIPGGSGDAGTVSGSSGNAVVEYTGPVLNFNGDDYLPRSAVPDLINTAAKRGADAGQSKMMKTFKNSRSQRASIGL